MGIKTNFFWEEFNLDKFAMHSLEDKNFSEIIAICSFIPFVVICFWTIL